MLESIAAGVISNFLTEYARRAFRWRLVFEEPERIREIIVVPPVPGVDEEALIRRAVNRERWNAISAFLAMVMWLMTFMFVATYLPLAFKEFSGSAVVFESTRLSFASGGISKFGAAAILVLLFYAPFFFLAQRGAQLIAGVIYREWADVSRELYVRLFVLCGIVLSLGLAGLSTFLAHPTVDPLHAFGFPFAGFGVMVMFAIVQRRA